MDADFAARLRAADWYALDCGCTKALGNNRWKHHALSGATPYLKPIEITKKGITACIVAVEDDMPIYATECGWDVSPGRAINLSFHWLETHASGEVEITSA